MRWQLSEESNILVSASESESSSQSNSKEEIEQHRTTDNSPDHVDKFVKPTGPTFRVPEDGTALDFFLLLWPEDLFEKIIEETNCNNEQRIQMKPDPSWYTTTCEEIRAFVALSICMVSSPYQKQECIGPKISFVVFQPFRKSC